MPDNNTAVESGETGSSTQEPLIPESHLQMVARALRVLAHPHRLRIVELLLTRPISVGELAERVNLSQAAVSQHLGHMRAQRIVEPRRQGRLVFYEVIDPHAKNLIACIRSHA